MKTAKLRRLPLRKIVIARSPKRDALARYIHSSPRFSYSAVCATIAIAMAGCATMPPDLTSGVKTVDKPYPVACVKAIPPLPPAPLIRVDADIAQRAAWARIRLTQLRQHDALLQAILVGCANPVGDPQK